MQAPISREVKRLKQRKRQERDERDKYREEILNASDGVEVHEKIELDSVGRSTLKGQ